MGASGSLRRFSRYDVISGEGDHDEEALEIAAMRAKRIEHLEAALALADEMEDGVVGYLIERALDATTTTDNGASIS